jgi:uncharacterized RDD family membrane protein YckC
MVSLMNATAQASQAPITGPKLDNRRVLAALVDLAIVVAGTVVILAAADALSGDSSDFRGALSAVILGWALYYYFALESGEGQTVGKKLLKLRVVRADGRPAGMREIAVRTVLRVVDGVGGYIVGLIVMLATGQRRQRLGDLAAGTIVVDASAPAFVAPVDAAPIEDEVEQERKIAPPAETSTITLPSRPAARATLEDLSTPEAPPVPEMRPFDPPAGEVELDEPVEDVEDEDVEHEIVEDESTVDVEDAALGEEPLPDISTPSLDELAHEVEAARAEPVPVVPEVEDEADDDGSDEDEPVEDEPVEDEPVEDEPITLKSVETVSAIDLVMGGAAEEDDSSEHDPDPEGPIAS